MEYGFTDIVDIFELQELVKVFDLTTSLSFTIKDHNGCEITSNKANSKFRTLRCRECYDGKCGQRVESIWFTGDKKRSCYEYRCNNGLLRIEVPVFLETNHLATAVFDNFFVDTNEKHIRLKPANCNFSPTQSYCHLKANIPALSREDMRKKIDSFCVLIDLLLSRGIRDIQIKKYESLFKTSENGTIPPFKDNKVLDNKTCLQMSLFSHELRTPLSIVKGYNELLYDGCLGELQTPQKAALDKSLCSIKRLERIIDSLLYVGMEHCNDHYYDCNPLNILDVIEASLIEVKKPLESKNINIQLSFPEKVPIIHGDGRKLSKALIHLLDNAIKFSPSGSNIFLSVTEKDDCLSLSIKDAGIGIIEEHLSCIFDGFYQGDTSLTRKYPGVGLGLNICEHIVRKHDGSIRVESKVNEGSTFHIDLPIKEQLNDCLPL